MVVPPLSVSPGVKVAPWPLNVPLIVLLLAVRVGLSTPVVSVKVCGLAGVRASSEPVVTGAPAASPF